MEYLDQQRLSDGIVNKVSQHSLSWSKSCWNQRALLLASTLPYGMHWLQRLMEPVLILPNSLDQQRINMAKHATRLLQQ